jgi:hypothetical protein
VAPHTLLIVLYDILVPSVTVSSPCNNIHWEPEYPRAQSQGYVLPPIPMQIAPSLHGLLTVAQRTSIS